MTAAVQIAFLELGNGRSGPSTPILAERPHPGRSAALLCQSRSRVPRERSIVIGRFDVGEIEVRTRAKGGFVRQGDGRLCHHHCSWCRWAEMERCRLAGRPTVVAK
jgi:hypothetical protein